MSGKIVGMSPEQGPPPATSQAARRANTALSLGLILILAATAILYLALPRPWANAFMASLIAGLTVLIIGLLIWSWRISRRPGVVLLNLGRTERQALYWIVGGLVLGIPTLLLFLLDEQHEAYRLAQIFFWFSAVVAGIVIYRQPTLITDKGWYKFGVQVPWEAIAAYQWEAPQKRTTVLVLHFKRRRYLAYSMNFRVPAAHTAAVEALLKAYSTAKPVERKIVN